MRSESLPFSPCSASGIVPWDGLTEDGLSPSGLNLIWHSRNSPGSSRDPQDGRSSQLRNDGLSDVRSVALTRGP